VKVLSSLSLDNFTLSANRWPYKLSKYSTPTTPPPLFETLSTEQILPVSKIVQFSMLTLNHFESCLVKEEEI